MVHDASPVLKGVKCMVDVHMSAGDVNVDCSTAVQKKLEGLGAKIVKRIGRDTTHVIWLNGNRNVRENILKRSDIKLVGPLWVEACAQTATHVPENKFFPAENESVKSTPLPTPNAEKKKRRRSSLMEPRREDILDERTTPSKKSRRQTLESVTPITITLPQQEEVHARSLKLHRRSRSPDYDDLSQPLISGLETVNEMPSQEVKASAPTPKSVDKQPRGPTPKNSRTEKKNTWACSACTFMNSKLAKKCKMCGLSSYNQKKSTGIDTENVTPNKSTHGQTRNVQQNISSGRRLSLVSPGKLPFGTPKTPPSVTKAATSVTIPLVKVASTTSIQTKSKANGVPQVNDEKKLKKPISKLETNHSNITKKGATSKSTVVKTKALKSKANPVATKKEPIKRNTEEPSTRNVKAKVSHTPIEPKPSILPTTSSKKVKTNTTTATTQKTRSTRHIISVSGATLDTKLILESTIRELDSNSPGDGKSRIVEDFNTPVTHVIVSDQSKRTMKILFGLAQGAWIVSDAWVFSSLDVKKWLDPKDFALKQYAMPMKSRKKLLEKKKIYIGACNEPSKTTLKALITAAGGQICTILAHADVCISQDDTLAQQTRVKIPMVQPKWLFDSLTSGRLKPFA